MKWFRWYRGTSENPKFSLIARRANNPLGVGEEDRLRGAVSLTDVLAVWITVLEDAGNSDHWGTCIKDAEFIAAVLQWWPDEVQSVLDEMGKAGLLDPGTNGGYKVAKWHIYQYSSDGDPTNAERQRRYYNRHKTHTKHQPNALAKRPDTDTDTDKRKKESSSSGDDGLTKFWLAYPRKIGKKAAEKAFLRAMKETTLEVILAALAKQKPKWTDPKYIPHPATWLNQGRWDDETEPKQKSDEVRHIGWRPGLPTHEELLVKYSRKETGNGHQPDSGEVVQGSEGIYSEDATRG